MDKLTKMQEIRDEYDKTKKEIYEELKAIYENKLNLKDENDYSGNSVIDSEIDWALEKLREALSNFEGFYHPSDSVKYYKKFVEYNEFLERLM